MSETSLPPDTNQTTPIPVVTTAKSSNIRRFPVQPVETTIRRSNKAKEKLTIEKSVEYESKNYTPTSFPKRQLPEPVETSSRSSRTKKTADTSSPTSLEITSKEAKPHRRFVPELIETSRRTKKAGDTGPATLPTDKTDLSPGVPNIYTSSCTRQRKPSANYANRWKASDRGNLNTHLLPFMPRRQGSTRPHCNTRIPSRQSSFTSSLEPISSSESNSGSPTSPSKTFSVSDSIGSTEDYNQRLQLARTRESCDERFSGYLLSLAAKAAEKQLREQVLLAAFPNEAKHEIVEHFYDREVDGASDNDSVGDVTIIHIDQVFGEKIKGNYNRKYLPLARRKSSESDWAIREMQLHQEKFSHSRGRMPSRGTEIDAPNNLYNDMLRIDGNNFNAVEREIVAKRELEKMRIAASPPMLGADLKFRRCPSPKPTKFESDQKANLQLNRSENGGGLWGGYCISEEPGEFLSPSLQGPELIQTPMIGESFGDPFSKLFAKELHQSKDEISSPWCGLKHTIEFNDHLHDEVPKNTDSNINLDEFDDYFVTQVYNYLSLGYPSLAWQFDDELSRISKIPTEKLRLDDQKHAKGHIRLKASITLPDSVRFENGRACDDKEESQKCVRWHALKIYIKEWGRQHPCLNQATMGLSAWGVRARRGSWAI